MGKVSIGLRGWRFEESDVFTDDGEFKPLEEIPKDDRRRLDRLPTLITAPCQACWLIYGDAEIERCNVPAVVYGEPLAEVVVCTDHETDFLYWFREEGGDAFAGEGALQDEFFEWFADGGRAPEGYAGVEHVDTDPASVPRPPEPEPEAFAVEQPKNPRTVDLREYGGDGDDGERAVRSDSDGREDLGDPVDPRELSDVLSTDYPRGDESAPNERIENEPARNERSDDGWTEDERSGDGPSRDDA